MCQPLTRRELLRYAALAAATPLVDTAWRPARAFAQVAATAVPMNLELVTLTETSAVLTWFTGDPTKPDSYGRPAPVPADTAFELGPSLTALRRVVERDDETPFHYVELTGLEPGRPYFYRAISNGIPATPTQLPGPYAAEVPATGTFTTPLPPPGRFLFAMAWCNDVHIGEMTSGLAVSNSSLPGGGFPPGFAADPANPYWRVMARAAVAEAKERGARLMIMNGDLTSEAKPVFMAEAKATFDAFGPYRDAYWVTRGNHDRAHRGPEWAACRPTAPEGYTDCLADAFFPDGRAYFSFDREGVHFVGLDTVEPVSGSGAMADEQFAWLEADLAANSGRPTFVFGHHPVTEESSTTAIPPVVFTLNADDARRLESSVAEHSVVGVYSGHTHRNRRTSSTRSPGVPYIELGATKEYPGGFGLVRVFEGGYAVNFYKTKSDPARAWSERSRGEYLGLYPYYTLGRLADRNFVVPADFSDAARSRSTEPAASPMPGAGASPAETPATGAEGRATAVGVAGSLGTSLPAGATPPASGRDRSSGGSSPRRRGPRARPARRASPHRRGRAIRRP
jgi:3',5'-cyclic AMP phosphodiesterase CpdA